MKLARYQSLCRDPHALRVWRGDQLPQPLRSALGVTLADGELLFAIGYDDVLAYSAVKELANAIGGSEAAYTSVPSLLQHHAADTGCGPCACPGSFVLVYRRARVGKR